MEKFVIIGLLACVATFYLFMSGAIIPTPSFDKNENIDKIEYHVHEDADSNNITATVTFLGDGSRKKLSPNDTVTINNKPMNGERYQSGYVGYKYSLNLDKAVLYELRVIHNDQEIKIQVKPQTYKAHLPSTISTNADLVIPFTEEALEKGDNVIKISSLDDKSSVVNTPLTKRTLHLKSIDQENKLVVDKSQLTDLKLGRVELSLVRLYGENYSISFKKIVEITK